MRIDKLLIQKTKEFCIKAKEKMIVYKEPVLEVTGYFMDLGLFIVMYGVPYSLAASIVSTRFGLDIPFSIPWIFIAGLVIYTIKEEMPRVIRNSFPQRNSE